MCVCVCVQGMCFHSRNSSGLSPDLHSMEQIRRIMRPTDVPDTGFSCYYLCVSQLMHEALFQDCCVIYCGLILIKTHKVGERMIEEFLLHLVQTLSANSSIDMTWTLSVELTRYP